MCFLLTCAADGCIQQFESSLQASKEALKSTQSELDDLLIVFSDMEDKVAKYKVRGFPVALYQHCLA